MQTLGTALQLIGNAIMLGGLLWAWHKASGRLNQWRAAIGTRLTQLRQTIASLAAPPRPTTHQATAHLTIHAQISAGATLRRSGTPDERLTRLENDYNDMLNQLTQQGSSVRAEIDEAIAAELEAFQSNANAVRLSDIYPAVFGLLVSIAGYLCQLLGLT